MTTSGTNYALQGKYHQLYVPQLWAPNPNMVELEKVNKRFSKKSNQIICLSVILALSTFINICHKFNFFSSSSRENCEKASHFFLFGALINICWELLILLMVYGLRQRKNLMLKIYLYCSGVLLCLMLANNFVWITAQEEENCIRNEASSFLNTTCAYLEILIVVIFIFLARYSTKMMHTIGNLRERLLSTPLPELS